MTIGSATTKSSLTKTSAHASPSFRGFRRVAGSCLRRRSLIATRGRAVRPPTGTAPATGLALGRAASITRRPRATPRPSTSPVPIRRRRAVHRRATAGTINVTSPGQLKVSGGTLNFNTMNLNNSSDLVLTQRNDWPNSCERDRHDQLVAIDPTPHPAHQLGRQLRRFNQRHAGPRHSCRDGSGEDGHAGGHAGHRSPDL